LEKVQELKDVALILKNAMEKNAKKPKNVLFNKQ